MRYLLTSNIDGKLMGALSPDQQKSLNDTFISFTQALAQSGVLRGAEHLHPAETATTVRNREGEMLLTDGPYADVAEVFGGFWIVEAPDLDSALRHAHECPAADVGSVEVRALHELG
ncbi:MAG: YciI family protein [Mycobacteriales bacterium]